MDNILGRTIAETRENLVVGNILSHNNILALIDAYVYGTSTPMIALIKTLRMMYWQVEAGKQIYYMDINGLKKTICKNTFEEFVLSISDEYVLKEIYSDDENELYG